MEELKQELFELIQSIDDVRILIKIRNFLIAINERIAQRVQCRRRTRYIKYNKLKQIGEMKNGCYLQNINSSI